MFRAFLLRALCAALASAPIVAQSRPEHSLEGVVRDSTGAVLVNAAVVLTLPEGGDRRTTTTDRNGRFAFRGLVAKAYKVAASANGFAEATQAVKVDDQPTASVELILMPVVAEHVEVSTQGALSASTGLTATMLQGPALEALPDDPAGLLQRVRELAGATDDTGQVTVTVDGYEQLMWLPPKQAIQAIRISSNWFAPEFAEPGQARVEIITKPGLNVVHGDVSANFNDEAINAPNALSTRHPSGHMREVTGYLSGPVIPRRWSFVVYRGLWAQQQNRVINATVLDPGYHATSHVDTVSTPSRVGSLWLGSNLQIAPGHTLAVSFSSTAERAENLGLDSGLDLPERSYGRTASNRALRATLTSVPSARVMHELRVQINPQHSTVRADSSAPAVIVLDAFNAGGNQEALFTDTRHVGVELVDSVTLFVPRHILKAGVSARSTTRRYTDATNVGGVFMFGADFERDGAGIPVDSGTGARTVISPLEAYRRTVLGLPGYEPAQFWISRGNPDIRFPESSLGAFAQDDWTPTPRVTLSYGLRSDWQSASSDARVGVRGGVAVALDGKRKNVVRAGAGTFYQRIEPELTLDVTRLDGRHQQQVLVDDPSFFPTVPADLASNSGSLPTIYVSHSGLHTPQILMSAASYERALTAHSFVTLKYSSQFGRDLVRTRNINAPDLAGDRPDARFGQVLQYESTGRLERHELTSGWRWNPGPRTFFANYSYVHGRSDTDGRATVPADGSRLDQEFGAAGADRTHAANIGANLTLPLGLFVSPYFIAASGRVFNITTGLDNNGDGLFADRPAVVAVGTPGAIQTVYGTFLPNRAADADLAPRNSGRDPAMVRFDVRVARAFRYRAAGSFALAVNVENVFNRANFEALNGVVTSPSFGLPKRAGSPRRVNLAASFSF